MRSKKSKSPKWHELQRLKNLSKYVNRQFDAGAYDDSPDGHKKASIFLETTRARIEDLERKT